MDNIETLETLGTKDTERRQIPPPPTNINKNETQHIPIKLNQGATHTLPKTPRWHQMFAIFSGIYYNIKYHSRIKNIRMWCFDKLLKMESVSYIVIFIMILWYFCFCFSFMISEVCHVWINKEILFISTQLDLLSFVKVILSGLFVLLFLVNFPF